LERRDDFECHCRDASAIKTSVDDGQLHPDPVHYVTKHLRQGIESDHFRVKKNMPKIGVFQSFKTARRTIAGLEAMLWLKKGFGFASAPCPKLIRLASNIVSFCEGRERLAIA
jgi:hypothetical protein